MMVSTWVTRHRQAEAKLNDAQMLVCEEAKRFLQSMPAKQMPLIALPLERAVRAWEQARDEEQRVLCLPIGDET
jgi:hypothetical protein